MEADKVQVAGAGELLLAQSLSGIEAPRVFNVRTEKDRCKGEFLEVDCVIYYKGRLFCIVNKYYRGKIQLRALKYPLILYKRFGSIRIPFVKSVFGGWDAETIYLNYEEEIQSFKNPIIELETFIEHFKIQLNKIDSNFSYIPVMGLVCFSNEEVEIGEVLQSMPQVVTLNNLVERIKSMTNDKRENELWVEEQLKYLLTKHSKAVY